MNTPALPPIFVPPGDCRDDTRPSAPPLAVQLISLCGAIFTAMVLIVGNGGGV